MEQQLPLRKAKDLSDGGLTAIVVSFVFSFLSTIFVGLRFYMRRIKRARVLLEDWLILVALIFQWGYVVVIFLLAFEGGIGWKSSQLDHDSIVQGSKLSLAGQTVWPTANGLIRISICLSFIRIFFIRPFRIAATTVYILSIGWSMATILIGYLVCTPLSELWTKTPGGHCGNTVVAYVSLGVSDVVLDIAVFSLPLPMLYRLQVAPHTKAALVATFGLGLFTIAAGIMRLVAVIQIDYMINFEQAQVGDAYWCTIESSVGIIVACSITLRPLLDRLLAILQRHFPHILSINKNRLTAKNKVTSQEPRTTTENTSFVRLKDHQDLHIEGLQISQQSLGNHVNQASFDPV